MGDKGDLTAYIAVRLAGYRELRRRSEAMFGPYTKTAFHEMLRVMHHDCAFNSGAAEGGISYLGTDENQNFYVEVYGENGAEHAVKYAEFLRQKIIEIERIPSVEFKTQSDMPSKYGLGIVLFSGNEHLESAANKTVRGASLTKAQQLLSKVEINEIVLEDDFRAVLQNPEIRDHYSELKSTRRTKSWHAKACQEYEKAERPDPAEGVGPLKAQHRIAQFTKKAVEKADHWARIISRWLL